MSVKEGRKKIMKKFLSVFIATIVISNFLITIIKNVSVIASEQGSLNISQEYIVENMGFWIDGSTATDIKNANFVSVDITRRIQYEDDDMLIFAFYTDGGELINSYTDFINTNFGKKTNIKIPIQITGNKLLGEVRVFIWNDFNDLIPVSNVLSSKNHSDTRFETVPSPEDEKDKNESDDIYEIPGGLGGEELPIVPSDKDDFLPEIPGMDDIDEF